MRLLHTVSKITMRSNQSPCKNCQKLTDLLVAVAGYTKGWFCNLDCFNQYGRSLERNRKPNFEYVCASCNKTFKEVRKQPVSKSGFYFCSRSCSNKETSKQRATSRKFSRDGYVTVYAPDHPHAKKDNPRIYEHRFVMEKKIGRLLQNEEVVHHINYLPEDNRIENLLLCKNQSEHSFVHRLTRWLVYEFIREKGFEIELTDYMRKRFVDSYIPGSYKELSEGRPIELFTKIFGPDFRGRGMGEAEDHSAETDRSEEEYSAETD